MKHSLFFNSFFIIYIVFLASLSEAEYAPNVRISEDLNQLLIRLSIRSNQPLPNSFYAQPMPASDIEAFLKQVENSQSLSSNDSSQIDQVRKYLYGRKYLQWTSPKKDICFRGHIKCSFDDNEKLSDSVASRLQGKLTPELSGNIGNFSYYSGLDVWTDYWSDSVFQMSSYQPYDGIPYNLYGRTDSSHLRSSDMVRGGIRYDGDWYKIETAIDYFRTGPAVYYPLTFSGYAPPLTFAKGSFNLGPIKYTQAFGQLKSQKDKSKYFYTHRYQCSLFKNHLVLGFNEVIVNGSTTDQQDSLSPNSLRRDYYGVERKLEWGYLIPIIPMKFTEHYIGDRDNGLMSFDADYHLPLNIRWYMEFLLDDISSPWTLFSDDWGNKWAFTTGIQWFGLFKGHDLSAIVEYSRVEPWVYTHFYGGSHRYDNFDVPLGNPLGPNTDALHIELTSSVNRHHSISLSFVNTRWNHKARGGNITDVFQDSIFNNYKTSDSTKTYDSPHKTFLGPGSERSSCIGLTWKYSPFGIISIGLSTDYDFGPGRDIISIHGWGAVNY